MDAKSRGEVTVLRWLAANSPVLQTSLTRKGDDGMPPPTALTVKAGAIPELNRMMPSPVNPNNITVGVSTRSASSERVVTREQTKQAVHKIGAPEHQSESLGSGTTLTVDSGEDDHEVILHGRSLEGDQGEKMATLASHQVNNRNVVLGHGSSTSPFSPAVNTSVCAGLSTTGHFC